MRGARRMSIIVAFRHEREIERKKERERERKERVTKAIPDEISFCPFEITVQSSRLLF